MNESARYFEFISNELVPYIQGKYPIANFKGIVASEEAGFLINYYLLSPKSPFSMYVSLNPTVIPRMAPEFATALAAGPSKNQHRLYYYMATADVENKLNYDKAINFEKGLHSMPIHQSVVYRFADMKGSSINSAKLQGIAQAFDECFDIYKPIGGKEYKTQMETLSVAIAIRTGVLKDGILNVQAAAGVVYDSVPEKEWQETEMKARAVLRAAEMATQIGRASCRERV